MKVQSVLIPKNKFNIIEARSYIRSHGYKLKKIDITENYYRFRQVDPVHGRDFANYKLKNGVILVLMS